MTRTNWLITSAIWNSFLVVFLIFLGLEFIFRVLDEVKLLQAGYTGSEIALVAISGMPRRLYLDLPLIILISVAVGLGGLAQSSELTILRAAGLSIHRIFLKIVVSLSPILFGCLFVAEYGMPQAERFSRALKDSNVSGGIHGSVWTRESGRFVFVQGAPDGSVRSWRQITMGDKKTEIASLTKAKNVIFSMNRVELIAASTLQFKDALIVKSQTNFNQISKLSTKRIRWLIQKPGALSLSELWDASNYLKNQGLNARSHSQLFWQRVLLPITLISLALLASATAFGSMRSLAMSTRVFIAVILGLIFKYTMDMTSPIVFLAGWHPSLAIILPLLIPLVLTPYLLR